MTIRDGNRRTIDLGPYEGEPVGSRSLRGCLPWQGDRVVSQPLIEPDQHRKAQVAAAQKRYRERRRAA